MTIQPGKSLGPYRIVAPLGAGGMGEVYRAHDERLERDVAIKILPDDVSADAERLERFEREARASAALNHPNIVAVHDIGRADDAAYVVMELLDGTTLREELDARPPTPRKALEWSIAIAEGLAAAHARGIVHRDIKPENLFVTADGRIKILDFGIARMTVGEQDSTVAATVASGTEPGQVLGTAGYMSPEQVRGEAVDARSDIFSLGAVLYEMLSGQRAFEGDTAVETMHAVLKADPLELTGTGSQVPPALDRVVRRCLEKRPEDRFHSTHDLALALEALSGSRTQPEAIVPEAPAVPRPGTAKLAAAALVLVAATFGVATWWAGGSAGRAFPEIRQITARRGTIDAARYRSGGDSVVYSARFEGAPPAPFEGRRDSPGAQQIGPDDALLFAEGRGELALGLQPERWSEQFIGRLALLPAGAGAAREIAERILAADFVVGGLAVIEQSGNGTRLHFPLGNVVEEPPAFHRLLRASSTGTSIAFFHIDEGLVLLDADGTRDVLDIGSVSGLAWAPAGDRVWYSTFSRQGQSTIFSYAPGGAPRLEWRAAGQLTLQDIATDGRLLVRRDELQGGTLLFTPGAENPIDFSWLDRSAAVAISTATSSVMFFDAGGVYLRPLDQSPAVRLGLGRPLAISPDGEFVISRPFTAQHFLLTPVGVGTPRELPHPGVEAYFAWFFPDGRRLLFNGREPGGTWRFFEMGLEGDGEWTRVGPDNLEHYIGQEPLSGDGRWLLGFPLPERNRVVTSLEDGETIAVRGIERDEVVIRFAEDPSEIYVFNRDVLPVRVYRLNYRTGERTLWRELMPPDPAGIAGVPTIAMSADGAVMAFNYERVLSTLYEIDGLQ